MDPGLRWADPAKRTVAVSGSGGDVLTTAMVVVLMHEHVPEHATASTPRREMVDPVRGGRIPACGGRIRPGGP